MQKLTDLARLSRRFVLAQLWVLWQPWGPLVGVSVYRLAGTEVSAFSRGHRKSWLICIQRSTGAWAVWVTGQRRGWRLWVHGLRRSWFCRLNLAAAVLNQDPKVWTPGSASRTTSSGFSQRKHASFWVLLDFGKKELNWAITQRSPSSI